MGKLVKSYIADGSALAQLLGKNVLAAPTKGRYRATLCSNSSPTRYIPIIFQMTCTRMFTAVLFIICKILETTQISINHNMD